MPKSTVLLAVENRAIGYYGSQAALQLVEAGEQEVVLWPLVLQESARGFRSPVGTYLGVSYYRGAKWASGRLQRARTVLCDPEVAKAQADDPYVFAIQRINPDRIYEVVLDDQHHRIREAAEFLGVPLTRLYANA
jgi:hypothetical protein